MTKMIHPEALKQYRNLKRWTQDQLAAATRGPSKVSLPTIKRIEGTREGAYRANDRVAVALSKALGVSPEDLSSVPSGERNNEQELRKLGYRQVRRMIDGRTALAFSMVRHLYGISIQSQIEMAPLFAALLAEGSFAWRRKRLEAIEAAARRLESLGGGHFSFANAAYRALDGAVDERASIEKRDLFGEHVGDEAYDLGFDPSTNNPFSDYLKMLASEVEAKTVTFTEGFGWKTSEGLPEYEIGAQLIEQLTANDPDAEYAVLSGRVQPEDVPEALLGDDRSAERVAWMVERIPSEELAARKSTRAELMAALGEIDLGDMGSLQGRFEGGEHA